MQINIQGLVFDTVSPSCYRLLSVRRDVGPNDQVYVAYDGMNWGIVYMPEAGGTRARGFKSRDHAVSFIADMRLADVVA